MRKLFAFVRHGFLLQIGHPFILLFPMLRSLAQVLLLYYVGQLVDRGSPTPLLFGAHYLPFVVVGIAASEYFGCVMRICEERIRTSQMAGLMDALFATSTRPHVVLICDSAFGMLLATGYFVCTLLLAQVFFGVHLQSVNVGSAVVGGLVAAAAQLGLGALSSAIIVVLRRDSPVTSALSLATMGLSGIYFPVALLPPWLRGISQLLPMTHVLEIFRHSLLKGASLGVVIVPLAKLAVMAVVLVPVGLAAFEAAVMSGKRRGTLGHY